MTAILARYLQSDRAAAGTTAAQADFDGISLIADQRIGQRTHVPALGELEQTLSYLSAGFCTKPHRCEKGAFRVFSNDMPRPAYIPPVRRYAGRLRQAVEQYGIDAALARA